VRFFCGVSRRKRRVKIVEESVYIYESEREYIKYLFTTTL